MDDTPRPTDRWLPLLAIALIGEAVAVSLALSSTDYEAQAVIALVAAALGTVTLLRSFRPEKNPDSWATAGLAIASLAAVLLAMSYAYFSVFKSVDRLGLNYFHFPALVLMGVGGPLLWSSALARREQPDHPRLEKLGRIGAGIAQLGFVFAFIQEIPTLANTFRFSGVPGVDATTYAISSMIRIVVRVLLLWASIEMMRTGSDGDEIRRRLAKVHVLMTAWAVSMVVHSGSLMVLYPRNPSYPALSHFWRNLVYATATVTVAFVLARRFRSLPKERAAEA